MAEMLAEAESMNSNIAALLQGDYGDDRRTTLTLAYLNLSLDHHKGIVMLMRSKLYGPALALVRVVLEAMIRAYWIVKCASDAQVDQVAENDAFKFPRMTDMTRAVDQAFSHPNEEPLTLFHQAMRDAWKATNSYTHSGLLQLARQFSGNRVEARYPDEDLMSGLNASTASVLMIGYLLAKFTEQAAQADAIEKLFSFGVSNSSIGRASQ